MLPGVHLPKRDEQVRDVREERPIPDAVLRGESWNPVFSLSIRVHTPSVPLPLSRARALSVTLVAPHVAPLCSRP
jgi:hypothetical protein